MIPQHLALRSGGWPRQTNLPLRGKTLGIVGLGRIGKAVALRGLAFLMPVIAIYLPVLLAILFTIWVSYQYVFAQIPVTSKDKEYIAYTSKRVNQNNESLMHALRVEFGPVAKWSTFGAINLVPDYPVAYA